MSLRVSHHSNHLACCQWWCETMKVLQHRPQLRREDIEIERGKRGVRATSTTWLKEVSTRTNTWTQKHKLNCLQFLSFFYFVPDIGDMLRASSQSHYSTTSNLAIPTELLTSIYCSNSSTHWRIHLSHLGGVSIRCWTQQFFFFPCMCVYHAQFEKPQRQTGWAKSSLFVNVKKFQAPSQHNPLKLGPPPSERGTKKNANAQQWNEGGGGSPS